MTGRPGWDSGRSLCSRQLARSHPTTMEPACGQGRLRLNKYASMPQRRCSYFHRFVWECKFMCVIPVYYINAPGQNENEYSHMRTLARMQLLLLKSINTHTMALPSLHRYSVLHMTQPLSRWSRTHILYVHVCVCAVFAADTKFMNVFWISICLVLTDKNNSPFLASYKQLNIFQIWSCKVK